MVRCRDATASSLSSNFGVKSSHIFTQTPSNDTVVCGINCLACQDEFLVKNPLDIKENDEHSLDLEFQLSRLFGLGEFEFGFSLYG
jgi:hypothetical protein